LSEKGKAIFEQIFEGKTAQILDHLAETTPFDFSVDELAKIHSMTYTEVFNIVQHLSDFKLVRKFQKNNITYYALEDNKKTQCLVIFLHEVMMDFFDAQKENHDA